MALNSPPSAFVRPTRRALCSVVPSRLPERGAAASGRTSCSYPTPDARTRLRDRVRPPEEVGVSEEEEWGAPGRWRWRIGGLSPAPRGPRGASSAPRGKRPLGQGRRDRPERGSSLEISGSPAQRRRHCLRPASGSLHPGNGLMPASGRQTKGRRLHPLGSPSAPGLHAPFPRPPPSAFRSGQPSTDSPPCSLSSFCRGVRRGPDTGGRCQAALQQRRSLVWGLQLPAGARRPPGTRDPQHALSPHLRPAASNDSQRRFLGP